MRIIVISGQSGAGKSVALHALEDIGFYGVDNLPVALLPALVGELGGDEAGGPQRIAAVVDVRTPRHDLADFDRVLEQVLGMGVDVQVLFLEADRQALVERFSETRRRHPLTEGNVSLPEALERESRLLEPLRRRAAFLIDSTRTNLHQLRTLIQERAGRDAGGGLSLLLQSFGYKRGIPRDADIVFDVRCLPNPHWEPELRSLTGRDAAVTEFLEASEAVRHMRGDLHSFLERWLPCFARENRAYLSVAVGCTGGRHRSVYLVEWLAARLGDHYPGLIVRHRELAG
jgi:UPF0042 nucleotide-binding protein